MRVGLVALVGPSAVRLVCLLRSSSAQLLERLVVVREVARRRPATRTSLGERSPARAGYGPVLLEEQQPGEMVTRVCSSGRPSAPRVGPEGEPMARPARGALVQRPEASDRVVEEVVVGLQGVVVVVVAMAS